MQIPTLEHIEFKTEIVKKGSWEAAICLDKSKLGGVVVVVQVTLSYGMFENKRNSIHMKGAFSVEEDPSR